MEVLVIKRRGKLSFGKQTVKRGYGRYLINQEIALPCTPENIKTMEEQIEILHRKEIELENNYKEIYEQINDKFIFITSPVNQTGNLYGNVTPKQIVQQIKAQLSNSDLITNEDINIDKLTKPGIFVARLHLTKTYIAKINIVIGNNENVIKEMYLAHINPEKEKDIKKDLEKNNKKKKVLNIHKDEIKNEEVTEEVTEQKED